MKVIETYIHDMNVEIDGKEYKVAPKTVEIAEKLSEAAKKCAGQPEYKLWLAEMEIVLGREAVRAIFKDGRKENLDRMYRIYTGVWEAFEYNAEEVNREKLERQQDALAGMTDTLKQLFGAMRMSEERKDRPDIIRRS